MYARVTTLGILAALAATLPQPAVPSFSLESSGAISLRAAGAEARFGVVPGAVRGGPILTLVLGAPATAGALHLSRLGDRPPAPGRYRIADSWDAAGDSTAFHAAFMPGTAERPLGWFHGESGWVTITHTRDGRIAGSFEIRARGFATDDPADEDRRVTVQGSFDAAADSTAPTIAAVR